MIILNRLQLLIYFLLFYLNSISLIYGQILKSAPWPMFKQNPFHTGFTNIDVTGPSQHPFIKWQYDTSFSIYGSPAIGPDDTIYIGNINGELFAFDKDGNLKWKFFADDSIYSSPAVDKKNTVYITCNNGFLYAITNGGIKWELKTNNICSSPIISTNNMIYIYGDYNKVFAITNGEIKWVYQTINTFSGNFPSPAIGNNNTLYVCDSGGVVYAITNGILKWSYTLDNYGGNSSPVIGTDNTVYIADGDYTSSQLYAITNGGLKWKVAIGQYCQTSPAIDKDGRVYIATYDGKISAISNGTILWTYTTNSAFYSSPTIDKNNVIYIGNENDYFYAITNGKIKWKIKLNSTYHYSTASIDMNNILYIASYDTLYSIIEENPPILLWSGNVGYTNDGVNPDKGIDGEFFRFEIKYIDVDNDYPITNQVWVDIDDDGIYEDNEKFNMYYKSGTSFSNGIIYTNLVQIFNTGDGIINYKFYFIDKYGTHSITNSPVSNHTVIITNINPSHILTVTKNIDINDYFYGRTNQTILSLKIWDSYGDTIKSFKIGNIGCITQNKQIKNVKLWLDYNNNFQYDSSDIFVANLKWDGTSFWTNNNITFQTSLSFPNINYIVTVDLTNNYLKKSNYFKAYIPVNGITCSGGLSVPSSPLTNNGIRWVDQFLLLKKLNIPIYYSSVVVGDVDNDGDLDLITSGYRGISGCLNEYINKGDGTFNSPVSLSPSIYYSSIVLVDIDNDGDLDLIISGYESGGTLAKYINDGTGNFIGPYTFGIGIQYSSIALGDINNDGYIDLITTGMDNNNLYRIDEYINSGNGNFSLTSYNTGVAYSSIVLGDMDNDGDLDLIVSGKDSNWKAHLDYYLNSEYIINSAPSIPTGLSMTNINGYWRLRWNYSLDDHTPTSEIRYNIAISVTASGDYKYISTNICYPRGEVNIGNVPLFTKNYYDTSISTNSRVYWKVCAIDSSFKYSLYSTELSNTNTIHQFIVIKNTNLPDRYYTNSFNNKTIMALYMIDTWGEPLMKLKVGNISNAIQGSDITAIKLWYDANNNNYYDVGDVYITNLEWNGTFWSNENINYSLGGGKNFVITVDFATNLNPLHGVKAYIPKNGVSTITSNAPLISITNQGTIKMAEGFIGPFEMSKGYNTPSMEFADIDNDGDLDLIINGYTGSKNLDKFINNGNGDFTGPTSIGTGCDRGDITCGDINNDGYIDIIVTGNGWSSTANYLDKYINDGTGNFLRTSFGQIVCDSSIALGDIDNDGDLDLIITGRIDTITTVGRLDAYTNDGYGNFSGPTPFGIGVYNSSIALGDMDNDGDLDLIVSGYSSSGIRLDYYTNKGNFNFSSPHPFGTGVANSSISIGDIDNDGDLDLIVMGYNAGYHLNEYINDGKGNFTSITFGTQTGNGATLLGDIDNDGDLDLVVVGRKGTAPPADNIRLDKYFNDGNGNFTGPFPFGRPLGENWWSSGVMGDIDNDGDLDLIVSGTSYPGAVIRMDKYFNVEHIINTPPSTPLNLRSTNINGYWRFIWDASSDDHSPAKLLRYKIAIRTNYSSGNYNFASDIVKYTHKVANLGNVTIVTGNYYQSTITNIQTVYWKVLAIDSSFKLSPYSAEALALYKCVHNITKNTYYPTITQALNDANNGDYLQAFPYIYREKVNISNFTNILLESISFASNNIITNTIITPPLNSEYAIKITNSQNITLKGFIIKNSTNGIEIKNSSHNKLNNNYIISNQQYGIYINNGNFNLIKSNIFYFNKGAGIFLDNTSSVTLFRDALFRNYKEAIKLYNGNNNGIINCTIVSNGLLNIYNSIDIDATSSFNLIKNCIIAYTKTGYGINDNGTSTILKYSDIFKNSSGNIYGNVTYGIGCITNNTGWFSYNIYQTNFLYLTNNSICIDKGDPSDTPPVNGGLRIDIGWKEYTLPYLNIKLIKMITNISLQSNNNIAIPGATLYYKIELLLSGNLPGSNIVIYDKIPSSIVYKTNYFSTTGWIIEYSTNIFPSQAYLSADYTTIIPSKSKIKWIRWKKASENPSIQNFYYKAIIK